MTSAWRTPPSLAERLRIMDEAGIRLDMMAEGLGVGDHHNARSDDRRVAHDESSA